MAPEGVIIGGWSYVIAGYAITVAGLALFAWSLRSRRRRIHHDDDSHE